MNINIYKTATLMELIYILYNQQLKSRFLKDHNQNNFMTRQFSVGTYTSNKICRGAMQSYLSS